MNVEDKAMVARLVALRKTVGQQTATKITALNT
jgi:hypothetical protein